MKLEYSQFTGMRTAVDARTLKSTEATDAVDCDLRYQTIKPFKALDISTLPQGEREPLGYLADGKADDAGTPISHLHDILHNQGGSIPKGVYEVNERGTYIAPSVVATDAHERVYFSRPGGGVYDRGRTDGLGSFEERVVGLAAPTTPDGITSYTVVGRSSAESSTTLKWRYYIEDQNTFEVVEKGSIDDALIEYEALTNEFGAQADRYKYLTPVGDAAHPLTSWGAGYYFIMYGEITSDKGRYLGTMFPEPSARYGDTDAYIGGTQADGKMGVDQSAAPVEYDYCDIVYTPVGEEYSYYKSYLITYVSDRGEESAPSIPTEPVPVAPTEKVVMEIQVASAPSNAEAVRVYRTETTDAGTAFFFVEEIPITDTVLNYTDLILSVDLDGDSLQTLNWSPPPTSLKGLTLSTKGFYAGYVGTQLFLSEPYIAYAWPTDYAIDFTGNIQHIARYGDTLAVFTDREIALIVGNTPLEVRKIKVEGFELLTSIYSTTEMDGLLYFCTPIGLAAISGTNVAVISDDLISERWWRDNINVTEARIVSFDNTLYVLQQPDGQIYRMGLQSDGGGFIRLSDTNVRDLYTSSSYRGVAFLRSNPEGDAYIFDVGSLGDRFVKWRGRTEVADVPMAVISVRILATQYPIKFRAYNEDAVQLELDITSDKVRKLPVMRRGREWSFEVEALETPANVVTIEVGTSGRVR